MSLKSPSSERPQENKPDAAGKLADLAENVGEKSGKMLKTGLDRLKLGMDVLGKKVMDAIDKIQPFGMDSKEIGLKISAVLAFLFKPEKKEADKHTPQENVDIMLSDAKHVDEMREAYLEADDNADEKKTWWDKLTDDFTSRIAKKESSGKPNSERLIQLGSIFAFNKDLSPIFDPAKKGLKLAESKPAKEIAALVAQKKLTLPRVISGNAERLLDDGMPPTLDAFKKQMGKVGIGIEILSRAALGTFQILPRYHFDKMGWPVTWETIYLFLKEPQKQEALMNKIVNDLAEKHDWDYELMAAEYYGGTPAVKAVLAHREGDIKNAKLLNKKQGVFDTISQYIQNIAGTKKA